MQADDGTQPVARSRFGVRISKLTAGMLLVSALLLWLNVESLGRSREISEQADLESRTLDVANQLERVNTNLRKAQAATRGYIINAEPVFERIFDAAMVNLGAAIARLKDYQLSVPDSVTLNRIEQLSDTLVDLQRDMFRLRKSLGPLEAARFFGHSSDHALISEAEQLLAQIRATEEDVLTRRQNHLVHLEDRARLAVPATTLVGFLLVLSVYFLIRRDMHDAAQHRKTLAQAHAQSEQQVLAATRELRVLNTELATANAAIRLQEARYHHLFEHAELSIWEEDFSEVMQYIREIESRHPDGMRDYLRLHPEAVGEALARLRVVDLNNRSLSLFGATSKSELLNGLSRTLLPESMAVFEAQLCALAEGVSTFVAPAVVCTLAGERRDVLVCITFAPQSTGLTSVPVCLVDITDRVRAADALRRSEQRFRGIFEQAADGIFVLGPDMRILESNASGASMLGYTVEEMSRLRAQDVLASHELPRLPLEMQRLRAGETHFGEWEHRRRDGSTFPAEINMSLIGVDSGIAVVRDISARREAERALLQRDEELQALSAQLLRVQEDERRALALELHDELGQKLAVLRISLAALKDRIADSEQRSKLEDMFSLANDLVCQIRATALNLRPAMLDTEGLVNTLDWHLWEQSRLVGIPISFHSEPLSGHLDSLVEIAAFRMVQESVTNAIKHASAVHIEVRMQTEDDWLLIQVRDDGAGFEQARRGTGSGLTGIQNRAMLLGGKVSLSSASGEGTCVDVALPLRPGPATAWHR